MGGGFFVGWALTSLGIVTLETLVDLAGLDKGLDTAKDKSEGVFGSLSDFGSAAITVGVAGVTAAIGALGTGLGFAMGEAMEAQTVMAQLDAVLASTGAGAGDYAAEYEKALNTTVETTRLAAWQIEDLEKKLAEAVESGDKDAIASISAAIAEGSELVTTTLADYANMLPPIEQVTKDTVVGLADSLSMVTRFGDEAILSGESMLLTFTSIGAEVFPRATETMLDMSQALGQDLKNSAIQLGKALNNPIEGVTALQRVGVSFTDSQKEMIAALVEAGDLVGAQTIILDELQKEFGGSAEAAGATFAGQLDILKNSLSNVAEGIGAVLLPIAQDFLNNFVLPAIPLVQEVGEALGFMLEALAGGDPGAAFDVLREAIFSIGQALGFSQSDLQAFNTTLTGIWNWITGTGVPTLLQLKDSVLGFLTPIGQAITSFVSWKDVLAAVGLAIAATLLPVIGTALATIAPIALTIAGVIAAVSLLRTAWETDFGGIQTALTAVWTETLQPIFTELWNWLQVAVPAALQFLSELWTGTLLPALEEFTEWYTTNLIPIWQGLYDWLAVQIPVAIQTLSDFWTGTLVPALETAWAFISENVVPILQEVWNWVAANLPSALETLAGFWTGTLQPALETVWAWIQDPLLPLLSELWTWLGETLATALEDLAGFWEETLLPAIESVWEFIQDPLFPLFESLANLFDTVVGKALEGLAVIWKETLLPALEDVWEYLSATLLPIFEDLKIFLEGTLGPALTTFTEGGLQLLLDGLEEVKKWLEKVIGWINKLAEAVAAVDFSPLDPAIPHSPPPLAQGLEMVADAMGSAITRLDDLGPAVNKAGSELGSFKKEMDGISTAGPMLFDPIATGAETFTGAIPTIFEPIVDGIGKFAGEIPMIFDPIAPSIADVLSEGILSGLKASLEGQPIFDQIEGYLKGAGNFGKIGNTFATIFEDSVVDPLKDRTKGLDKSIEQKLKQISELAGIDITSVPQLQEMSTLLANMNLGPEAAALYNEINDAYEERLETVEQLGIEEQRLLEFQQQQQDIAFMQAQLDLLKLVQESGLDASILAGLTTGLDADAGNLMDVMAQVMEQLIAQANDTLGIASPSKVFADMGDNVTETLTDRLWAGATDVAQAMAGITDEMMVADSTSYAPAQVAQQAVYAVNTSGQAGQVVHEYNFYNPVITNRQETEKLIEDAFRRRGERADVIRRTG